MRRTIRTAHTGVAGEAPRTRSKEVRPTMNTMQQRLAADGLARPTQGRVLGGVCAGLGRRFGFRPWPARLLFLLLLMVIPGSQLLIYPILWIVMPSDEPAAFPPASPSTST